MTKPILEDIASNQDNPINCQEKILRGEEVDDFWILKKRRQLPNHMLGVGGRSSNDGKCWIDLWNKGHH